MDVYIVNLDDKQLEEVETCLEEYDRKHITYKLDGIIQLGACVDGKIVGGLGACMTAYRILYVSTVFIDEAYRNKGIGSLLVTEMERRAKELGANMIRVDTFDWQGKDFYTKLGYEQIGYYTNEEDNFSEYFFLKRI